MTGDENDGGVRKGAVEFLLKLKPVHPRQINVGHDTIESLRINGFEQFFRSGVSSDLEARGAELEGESPAHALVVLDYCDFDPSVGRISCGRVEVFRAAS